MSRSIWKSVYVDNLLVNKLLFDEQVFSNGIPYQTNSRESTILCEFIGKTIGVHSGKQYFFIPVNKLMPGYKLGAFVHTKKLCIYRKLKKTNKKYTKKH